MPVVDAHVHIFPDEVVRYRDRFVARDRWFAQLYASERARLANMDELIESMDGAGIDLSVACGFPWADQGLCDYHNDFLFEAARAFPDRIAWLAIAAPAQGEKAVRSLDENLARGARGLGELNADAQGFNLDDPTQLGAVLEVCLARNKAAMFHISEPVGHDYPGKGASTPAKLLKVLSAHPELKVVAAHWGGGLPFYELMPEVRATTANLAYDSAATTYLYDHQVFETVTSLVGDERVLFASDFPVLKQGPLLNRVRQRPGLSDATRARILGENAIRVYGLQEKFQ